MQNKEYASKLAISQSAIKDFKFKSPKKWKEIWLDKQLDLSKNEETFVFGSLVDTLLFSPDELQERYYITTSNSLPAPAVAKIVKSTYDEARLDPEKFISIQKFETIDDPEFPEPIVKVNFDLGELRDIILKVCDEEQWSTNWKADTRVNKIIEKGSEYFELLTQSHDRKIISSEMNLEAIDIVNNMKNSDLVKKYFVDYDSFRNKYQVELYSKYISNDMYEVDLKGAIDILHINDKLKTIQVVDFKTSHSAHNFIESIKKYGYCDQLSFYTHLIKDGLKDEESCERHKIDESYKVLEPLNIVVDTDTKAPYLYEYNWNDINIATYGNAKYLFDLFQTQDHNAKIKKGWLEILNDIAWHMHTHNWDYPREQYSNGKIKVNLLNS